MQQQHLQMAVVEAPLFRVALAAYDRLLGNIEEVIAKDGWLAGGVYSLADISYVPYVARLYHLKLDGLFDGRPGLRDWYSRQREREPFRKAIDDWAPESVLTPMAEHGAEAWPRVEEILKEIRGEPEKAAIS